MENWNIINDGPFKSMPITDRPPSVKKNLQFLLIYDGKELHAWMFIPSINESSRQFFRSLNRPFFHRTQCSPWWYEHDRYILDRHSLVLQRYLRFC